MQRLLVIAEDAEMARQVRQLAFSALGKVLPVDYAYDNRVGLLTALGGLHSLIVISSLAEPLAWQEVLREIRDRLGTRDTPVFVLFDEKDPGSETLGFEPGETWFFHQPCDSRQLAAALVAALVESRIASAAASSGPGGDGRLTGLRPLGG